MVVQLPEPDYYTLAEVAKKWGKSEDVLLRLGAENKVLMGYPLEFQLAYAMRPTQKEGCVGWEGLSTEMLRAIGIELDNIPYAEEGNDNIVRFPVGGVAACNKEIKFAIALKRDSFRLDFITGFTFYRASDSPPALAPPLPPDYHYGVCRKALDVSFTDLVIPTAEIHRIEHQHEAAEEAAADDVLGTKEKEKLQGIIAAMAQILASKSHAYKNGDNPNAHAIAEAVVETGLVDRAVGTVQKEIGTACTWAKKWSGK